MTGITQFIDENAFLSNFYVTPVMYEGLEYPSSENAYQAAKTDNQVERARFRLTSMTPAMAKRYGRTLKTTDWDQKKDRIMLKIVRSKFENPKLRARLSQTGTSYLTEGNNWHDTYWGVCDGHCRTPHPNLIGENKLGKILERVRYEITVSSYRDRLLNPQADSEAAV